MGRGFDSLLFGEALACPEAWATSWRMCGRAAAGVKESALATELDAKLKVKLGCMRGTSGSRWTWNSPSMPNWM